MVIYEHTINDALGVVQQSLCRRNGRVRSVEIRDIWGRPKPPDMPVGEVSQRRLPIDVGRCILPTVREDVQELARKNEDRGPSRAQGMLLMTAEAVMLDTDGSSAVQRNA